MQKVSQLVRLSALVAVVGVAFLLPACWAKHGSDDLPVYYVGDPRFTIAADRLTRFLASPLIIVGDGIRRVATVNAATKHLDVYSVHIAKAVRDVDRLLLPLNQHPILVVVSENVAADSDGNISAYFKWTKSTQPELTGRALFYLKRDNNLDVLVPVELRAVWSIQSIAPAANLETFRHDLANQISPNAEHLSDERIFAARYGSSARAYHNYRRSLAVCPERVLVALFRSQTDLHQRRVFETMRDLCEQPRGRLSL